MGEQLVIVGNGDLDDEARRAISQADVIVRFNDPPASHQVLPLRTHFLVLSNTSKQTGARMADHAYLRGPVFGGAERLLLAMDPQCVRAYVASPNPLSWLKGRRRDYAGLCKAAAARAGKPVETISAGIYERACTELGISGVDRRSAFPSSGMLAILHFIERTGGRDGRRPLQLAGFGFTGWKRHRWDAERELASRLAHEGLVRMIGT